MYCHWRCVDCYLGVHVSMITMLFMRGECDVLPLEVCGLLLGRPWQYDHNVIHAGRENTYTFSHDGKQRTLKAYDR